MDIRGQTGKTLYCLNVLVDIGVVDVDVPVGSTRTRTTSCCFSCCFCCFCLCPRVFYEDPRYIMFIYMVVNDAMQLSLVTTLYVVSYVFRQIHATVCCILVLNNTDRL